MKQHFTHTCSRRTVPKRRPPFGAGSGGGPVEINEVDVAVENPGAEGGHTEAYDGAYAIRANQFEFVSRPPMPPAEQIDFLIKLFAPGTGEDGRIEIGGSQSVRLTAGPPLDPPVSSDSTAGVDIFVGEEQSITIKRGLIPDVDQLISMEPESILIDGGVGPVVIQSMTEVTLQVADGLSFIRLTPDGIILQGVVIEIN